jgi:hypothetical protein
MMPPVSRTIWAIHSGRGLLLALALLGHDLAEVAVRDVDRVIVAGPIESGRRDAALGHVGDVDEHAAVHHLGDQRVPVGGEAEHVLAVLVDVEAQRDGGAGQVAVHVDVAVLGVLRDVEDGVVGRGAAKRLSSWCTGCSVRTPSA